MSAPDLPALPTDLRRLLRESIEAQGILVPVLVDALTGDVIDGRLRLEIAEELGIQDVPTIYLSKLSQQDRDDIRTSVNCYRRHLTAKQRRTILEWAVRTTPEQSNRAIAGRVGCDHSTVAAARKRVDSGGGIPQLNFHRGKDGKKYPASKPNIFSASASQGRRITKTLKELGDQVPDSNLSTRDLRRLLGGKRRSEQDRTPVSLPSDIDIRHCDFRKLDIPGIAHLVLADPPWLDGWQAHRRDFAASVYRCLRPGGYVVAYTGVLNFPPWLRVWHESGLVHRWLIACVNSNQQGTIHGGAIHGSSVRGVWRPALLLQRPGGKIKLPHVLMDCLQYRTGEKTHHEWQQPLEESLTFIECLSRPGDLVADLTLGSGTSAVAACRLGRRFIGCDVDASTVRLARRRVAEELSVHAGKSASKRAVR